MGITICMGDVRHLRYSTFNELRNTLCVSAGYGKTTDYSSYGGDKKWTPEQINDSLVIHFLLKHDDGDEIPSQYCNILANRLDEIKNNITELEYFELTKQFAEELRSCEKENRGFYWR